MVERRSDGRALDSARLEDGELVAFRESSVTVLAAQGRLDADQVAAAFKFRSSFLITVDAKRASLGFQEWAAPGQPPAHVLEQRADAKKDLTIARRYLGAHGYWLVGKVCGEGYHVRDFAKTRRERDALSYMLQVHLRGLAAVWR